MPQPKTPSIQTLVIAISLVLMTAGCFTSHVRTPSATAEDVQFTRSLDPAPAFSYERSDIPFTNHIESTGAAPHYQLRTLEIPSIGDNGQPGNMITSRYFRSTLPGPQPLVIVLPIWGTYTYPPRKIAKSLQYRAEGAVHVLYIQGETHLTDWTGMVGAENEQEFLDLWHEAAERLRVNIVDVRRLIDWAETRPEIDADRIGLIGFSLGAVLAGTLATQEPRLAATVTVMGGSHLQSVIAYCDGKRTTSVQEKVAGSFGWSREYLESQLEPIVDFLDSANYPNRANPERVLIITASRDKCMPEHSREDLWLTLGKPERISMKYDHAPAFYSMTPLGFNWMRYRIWDFFEEKLLESPPSPSRQTDEDNEMGS